MGLLHGAFAWARRAPNSQKPGRLTAKNGGFWPGQSTFTLNFWRACFKGHCEKVNSPNLITFGQMASDPYELWQLPICPCPPGAFTWP